MMRRRGTCIGAIVFAMIALPGGAFAQDVFDLEVGDPGRRDQRAALVLDGIVDSHTAELITPGELADKVGLSGGNMTSAMKALGCVGAISDGPSRDIDEIRPMKFQYMLNGVTAGHGPMAVKAVNVPVTVAGMDVCAGEVVHMDENGACKFPADKLDAVLRNVRALQQEEEARIGALQKATTAAEVRAIFAAHSYTGDEPDKH